VKTKYFYLIISGPIYIMDKNCMFWYGSLGDGSYFGDISLFFDEPSQYSYAYNPFQGIRPIQLLAINGDEFIRLCRKYPLSFEVLLHRAYKRKKMFHNYKLMHLVNLMKGIKKESVCIQERIIEDKPKWEQQDLLRKLLIRLNLFKAFLRQFELLNNMEQIEKIEKIKEKIDTTEEDSHSSRNQGDNSFEELSKNLKITLKQYKKTHKANGNLWTDRTHIKDGEMVGQDSISSNASDSEEPDINIIKIAEFKNSEIKDTYRGQNSK